MHLKQPKFTYSEYSACGPFAKNKERMQQFKETGELQTKELQKANQKDFRIAKVIN